MSSDTDSDGHPMDAAVRARVAAPKPHTRPKPSTPTSSLESGEVPPSRDPIPSRDPTPSRDPNPTAPSLSEPTPTRKKRKKKKKKRTPVSPSPSISGPPAATPSPATSDQKPAPPVGVQLYDASNAPASANEAMRRLLRQPRYFDQGDITTPSGPRCYRCGGMGHLARTCTRDAAIRPCHLCAQMNHDAQECPNTLCFRCGLPGHRATDCDKPAGGGPTGPCLRCGSPYCRAANAHDGVRAAGGCTDGYHPDDLALVRCYVCGEHGHLCCGIVDAPVPHPSCFNCGGEHKGIQCDLAPTPPVRAERAFQRARLAGHQDRRR